MGTIMSNTVHNGYRYEKQIIITCSRFVNCKPFLSLSTGSNTNLFVNASDLI